MSTRATSQHPSGHPDDSQDDTHPAATLEPEGRPLRSMEEILEERFQQRQEEPDGDGMEISESFQNRKPAASAAPKGLKKEDFPSGDEEDREGFHGPDKRTDAERR